MLLGDGLFRCYKCTFPRPLAERCSNRMCKQCFSDYKKKRRLADPGPTLRKTAEYRASHKAEISASGKIYREKNQGREASRKAVWSRSNPINRLESQARRRALKRGTQVVKITKAQLADRLAVFGGRCSYCLTGLFEHWDHLMPLELGGPHILSNLRPSCARCNLRKGVVSPREWLAKCKAAREHS